MSLEDGGSQSTGRTKKKEKCVFLEEGVPERNGKIGHKKEV